MAIEPSTGDVAPPFELPEAYGGEVVLSELLRNHIVVLAFYPSPFGMMCAVEMRQFKSMYEDFKKASIEILGITTSSRFVLSAWRERLNLPFPQLSDYGGEISVAYGVLAGEEGALRGRSNRAVFIIDQRGIIRYRWVSPDIIQAQEPDYDAVLSLCRSIADEPNPSPVPADNTH